MATTTRKIKTSFADIAVCETSGTELPIVFLHGNSSHKEAFRRQYEAPLGERHRMIGIDLPGHGASSDAIDVAVAYTIPGYADAVIEVLGALDVRRAAVVGWSLGGHVALEMIPRFEGIAGVMIVAAPPVGRSPEEIQAGFRQTPDILLAGKPDFTEAEIDAFAAATTGTPVDPALRAAIARTDGRARATMFASLFAGQVADEREIVEQSPVPIAVVNGSNDPLINVDYIGGLAYRNLWDQHCYLLRGAGHACFIREPAAFNAILGRFAADMAGLAARKPAGKSKVVAA